MKRGVYIMKKVLQITNYMYPHIGGIEQVTRDILNSIKDNYEQKIICFNHEKGNVIDTVDGVEVTRVNCQVKISSQSIALSFGKKLKKLLKEFKPDIVIFHYPNPFVAHSLMKHLKHKEFKFIIYWHLDITKQKILGKLFNGQNKRLLKYADKIIATSPNYKEESPWLSQKKEKVVVIPNCIDEKRLSYTDIDLKKAQDIKDQYKDKTILFGFGRHVPYKGLIHLVNASKLLSDDYVVLIGGKGKLTDELKKAAKNDNKVRFLGAIPDDELKATILACDIFCFPSITKNEAFGIGLAEAMYYQKASVTFNIPCSGVNYVSLKDVTGLEVENSNDEAFAKAIETLKNDEKLRNKFEKNAKERVEELFSSEEFKKNINNLLGELE